MSLGEPKLVLWSLGELEEARWDPKLHGPYYGAIKPKKGLKPLQDISSLEQCIVEHILGRTTNLSQGLGWDTRCPWQPNRRT